MKFLHRALQPFSLFFWAASFLGPGIIQRIRRLEIRPSRNSPTVHEAPAFLEKISPPVGGLYLVADHVAQAPLRRPPAGNSSVPQPSRGRSSGIHGPSDSRVPFVAAASTAPCSTANRQSGRRIRGRSGLPFLSVVRTANASVESGTRCSRLLFMRDAGTVQTFAFRSISSQRAPMISPVRAAVRIVNSRALAATPACSRSVFMNCGVSS